MIYVEWLRARQRLLYAMGSLGAIVLALTAGVYFGHAHHSATGWSFGWTSDSRPGEPSGREVIPQLAGQITLPVGALVLIAAYLGALFATTLATSLNAQRASLDIAFTKPLARARCALAFVAVDLAAIVAFEIFVVLLALVVFALFGVIGRIVVAPDDGPTVALGLGAAALLYGLLQLCTAGLRRGAGAVVGVVWIVFVFAVSYRRPTHVAALDVLLQALRAVDPLRYLAYLSDSHQSPPGPMIALSWVIAAVALALAITIWQRQEA